MASASLDCIMIVNSLGVNDIPKAVLVLNKAYEYLTSHGRAEAELEAKA